jgi:transposase, IS5 family
MLVLKHLWDWSFDECEREVRGSLVYRAFCRIDGERVPDAKTLIRRAQLLDGPILTQLLDRLAPIARQRRVIRGRRLRVDTTVVETTIHYPTDSAWLADGVRVLTRTMKRLTACRPGQRPVRERARRIARRVWAIAQHTRTATLRASHAVRERSKTRMRQLDRGLLRITRSVLRQAERTERVRRFPPEPAVRRRRDRLRPTIRLVRRVVAQTRARVLRGDPHSRDKVLSVFEPHTEAIRTGKATKLTEFGKLVKIQEAEAQFITDYAVWATRVPDQTRWVPSLVRHAQLCGRPPRLAVADGGFAARANELAARAHGGHHVVLPRHRREGRSRRDRAALRWRTGSEGRISVRKRRHGLRRCRYRGLPGMERWVGLGILANNLVVARPGEPSNGVTGSHDGAASPDGRRSESSGSLHPPEPGLGGDAPVSDHLRTRK